jgi:hypothetical protein
MNNADRERNDDVTHARCVSSRRNARSSSLCADRRAREKKFLHTEENARVMEETPNEIALKRSRDLCPAESSVVWMAAAQRE